MFRQQTQGRICRGVAILPLCVVGEDNTAEIGHAAGEQQKLEVKEQMTNDNDNDNVLSLVPSP